MPNPAGGTLVLEDKLRQRHLLMLISLVTFMGALDSTIVNISLPTISTYFNTSITVVSWVAMAYLLTLASTLIAFAGSPISADTGTCTTGTLPSSPRDRFSAECSRLLSIT